MNLPLFLSNSRHAAELRRAVRNRRYERTESGIRVASMGIAVGGHGESFVNEGPHAVAPNVMTDQGINHMFDVLMGVGTKTATWYFVPFLGTGTPSTALTAANFDATLTEFTNYASTPRATYVEAAGSKSMTNSASPALLTINADTQTVWGAGLSSVSTKSSASGFILCAFKFAAARSGLMTDDVLGLIYTLSAADDDA